MRIASAVVLCLVAACYTERLTMPHGAEPVRAASTPSSREHICIDQCAGSPWVREPYLLIIDGVVNGVPGDSVRARLAMQTLDPNDVESVEILSAPRASQLYGTNPCSAIVVTTKHARTRR
jgi:hypothetical protein